METETANDYLSRCPHWKDCGDVICSPWGFVSTQELQGVPKLLVVGLNDNRSKDLPDTIDRRDSYSEKYFTVEIRNEVKAEKWKCISNLMPPIARFLFGNVSQESQIEALEVIEFCNVVSCCPGPTQVASASNPSNKMRQNCGKRLQDEEEGAGHELLHRLLRFRPTLILVLGGDAKNVWEKASRPGRVLSETLSQISKPIVVFVPHPSQRDRSPVSRDKYWNLVYKRLSEASEIP